MRRSLGTKQHYIFQELIKSPECSEYRMKVIEIILICSEEERVHYSTSQISSVNPGGE